MKTLCRLLILLAFILCLGTAHAGVAYPRQASLTQPDSSVFTVTAKGNEHSHWLEGAANGYTAAFNPLTGWWEYATLNQAGALIPSGAPFREDGQGVPLGISPHLKPLPDSTSVKALSDLLKAASTRRVPTPPALARTVAGAPVTGQRKLLAVLVNFDNDAVDPAQSSFLDTAAASEADWNILLFSTVPGALSAANYFSDNSYGAFTLAPCPAPTPGVVTVTVNLPHPEYPGGPTTEQWAAAALAGAEGLVDFATLDLNNDGHLLPDELGILFILAGYEGAFGPASPAVWSSSGYSEAGFLSDGKLIHGYSYAGELMSVEDPNRGNAVVTLPTSLGPLLHELLHQLPGLPDLSDATGSNAGMGAFSPMAYGQYGSADLLAEFPGERPVALDGWSREFLGWAQPVEPVTNLPVLFPACLASPSSLLKLSMPSKSTLEYWLAENRNPEGWDLGLNTLLADLPLAGALASFQGGLLILHVNNGAGSAEQNDMNLTRFDAFGEPYSLQTAVPEVANPYYGDLAYRVDSTVSPIGGSPRPVWADTRGTPHTLFFSGDATAVDWFFYSPGMLWPMPVYHDGTNSPDLKLEDISPPGPLMSANLSADLTGPKVTVFTVNPRSTSKLVPILGITAVDNRQVAGYAVTASAVKPAANSPVWKATPPTQFAFTTTGVKTLYAYAKDALGNVSAPKAATTTIALSDTTPPFLNFFSVPAYSNSMSVRVSLSGTDNVKVTGYMVTETPTPPAADSPLWSAGPISAFFTMKNVGANLLYGWARDSAGNISNLTSRSIFVDMTKPVVSSFAIAANSKSLYVPVTAFTATDNKLVSGWAITSIPFPPGQDSPLWQAAPPKNFTAASPGTYTAYAWARDAAWNVSAFATAKTTIDISPPGVTAFTVPAASNSLTVPISAFTATDNVKVTGYKVTETANASTLGWSATRPLSYTTATQGTKTLYAWALDAAGNVSGLRTAKVLFDLQKPVINSFVAPASVKGLTVSITLFTATDLNGVAGFLITETAAPPAPSNPKWVYPAPKTYATLSTGQKTLYGWVKDKAGNLSLPKLAPVKFNP